MVSLVVEGHFWFYTSRRDNFSLFHILWKTANSVFNSYVIFMVISCESQGVSVLHSVGVLSFYTSSIIST